MVSISPITAGAIGLCISSILWLLCTWRLFFHTKICCRGGQCRTIVLTPRRLFHGLLWIAMLVECLSYTDLCRIITLANTRAKAERIGYVLSEVFGRSIFEFLSFSVVTALWFTTEAEARSVSTNERNLVVDSLPRVLLIWASLLVATSVLQALDIYRVDDQSGFQGSTLVFRVHTLVESVSWGTHAILAIVCVHMTYQRITGLSTFPQTPPQVWLRILLSTLLPMAVCASCYGLRSVWLMAQMTLSAPAVAAGRKHLVRWFWFIWFPTVVPVVTLLYSARKRDPRTATASSNDSMSVPLMPADPVPPAEAFVSFRRFAENADLFSPLAAMRISDDSDIDDGDDDNDYNGSVGTSRESAVRLGEHLDTEAQDEADEEGSTSHDKDANEQMDSTVPLDTTQEA